MDFLHFQCTNCQLVLNGLPLMDMSWQFVANKTFNVYSVFYVLESASDYFLVMNVIKSIYFVMLIMICHSYILQHNWSEYSDNTPHSEITIVSFVV